MDKPGVLFITKDYPPHTGGMARYCHDLVRNIAPFFHIRLIAHKGTKKQIPIFAVTAFVRALVAVRGCRLVHVGDGMLAPVALALKWISRRPVSITIHGLDMTREHWLYRRLIPPAVRRLDHVICVSGYTRDVCIARGIDPGRIEVIPNGIDFEAFYDQALDEATWRRRYDIAAGDRVLFTIGNFTRRKGVEWFVRNVLSTMTRVDYRYFIIGSGKERHLVEAAIRQSPARDRIVLLGPLDFPDRDAFYKFGDLYVMPNIHVPGDAEGFGIVAIEAGAWGLPVLTSAIEGIADAVVPDETALVYDGAEACRARLEAFLDGRLQVRDPEKIPAIVRERYDWRRLAQRYRSLFGGLLAGAPARG